MHKLIIYIIPIYNILSNIIEFIIDNQKFKHNGQLINLNINKFLNPKYSIKFK